MNLQDMDLEQYDFSKKELYQDNEKWINDLSFYYSLVKICLLEDFFSIPGIENIKLSSSLETENYSINNDSYTYQANTFIHPEYDFFKGYHYHKNKKQNEKQFTILFEKIKQLDSEIVEFIQEKCFECEDNNSHFNVAIELMNKFLISEEDEELNITWGKRFEVYSDILQLYNDKPYFLEKLDIFLENLNNKSTENLTVELYGMDYFIFPYTEEHYTNNILLKQNKNHFKNASDYKHLIDFLKDLTNSSENNEKQFFYCYIDKETKELVIKKENEQEILSQRNIVGDTDNISFFLDRIGTILYNRKQQQEKNFFKNKSPNDKNLFISSLKSLFEKTIIQDVLPTTNNLKHNKKRL